MCLLSLAEKYKKKGKSLSPLNENSGSTMFNVGKEASLTANRNELQLAVSYWRLA
jgi:hypothetical protein